MATNSTHQIEITFKALPETVFQLTINTEEAIPMIDKQEEEFVDLFRSYRYSGNFDTQSVWIKLEALPDTIIDLSIRVNQKELVYATSRGKTTISYVARIGRQRISFSKEEPPINHNITGEVIINTINEEPDSRGFGLENAHKEEHYTVDVFYATNRLKEGGEKAIHFGTQKTPFEITNYGICRVNIPTGKMLGEIPRPKWWKLQFKPNPQKHMNILDVELMDVTAYFTKLGDRINVSKEKEAFIFIHGFNVDFEEAALRAAQICVDISFEGVPIMYSWPSQGKGIFYTADGNSIEYSIPLIMRFLKDVRDRTGAKNIHIIAHSMGNRGLTRALIQLRNENFYNQFIFNQVILAAPDIDAGIFIHEIAPQLQNCSKRVTLYASNKDKALQLSKSINKGPRAGDSGPDIICVNGVDTIDASDVNTDFLGHGYFASTLSLINDIYHLVKHGHPPDQRNLLPQEKQTLKYWKLKRPFK